MKKNITFIHTGDLHLGARLSLPKELDKGTASRLKDSVNSAFWNVIDTAVTRNVDFLLLSGDIFDFHEKNVEAYLTFIKGMEKLEKEGIMVYLISGNHDPKSGWNTLFPLPKNVVHFTSERVDRAYFVGKSGTKEALILGRSYERKADNRKLELKLPELSDDLWNIFMIHTNLTKEDKNYIPLSLEDLRQTDNHVDYYALGHVHQLRILREALPAVAFCGTIQGKDMGEQHTGNCILVTLKEGQPPLLQPFHTTKTIYHEERIRLTETLTDTDELLNRLLERLPGVFDRLSEEFSLAKDILLRLTISCPFQKYGEALESIDILNRELTEKLNADWEGTSRGIYLHSLELSILPDPLSISYYEDLPLMKNLDELTAQLFESVDGQKTLQKWISDLFELNPMTEEEHPKKIPLTEEDLQAILRSARDQVLYQLQERGIDA